MFSPTIINEARVRISVQHTNRMPTYGTDTNDLPGRYGIRGIPQLVGNGGLPTLQISGLSDLGHAGWVVGERFSNTLQFSDNLPKILSAHLQDRLYVPGHFLRLHAAAIHAWPVQLGRPLYLDGESDRQHDVPRECGASSDSVDRTGGFNDLGGFQAIRVSPFGAVNAFKTYHGALAGQLADVGNFHVNYGLRWDFFEPRAGAWGEQADLVPVRRRNTDSCGMAVGAYIGELQEQPRRRQSRARLHRRLRQRARQDAEE